MKQNSVENLTRKIFQEGTVKKLKKEYLLKFYRKPIPENNAGSPVPSSTLWWLQAGVYDIISHFCDFPIVVVHEKNSFIAGSFIMC